MTDEQIKAKIEQAEKEQAELLARANFIAGYAQALRDVLQPQPEQPAKQA